MNNIYTKLNFPEVAKVDKKINIEKFLNPKNINNDEKLIFKKIVNEIKIKYMLNNSTTIIKNKTVNGFTYQEIIVLEIDINNPSGVYDVALVVGRAIIYPVIMVIKYNNKYKIDFIKNNVGKVNYDINVIKKIMFTGWIDEKHISTRTDQLLLKLEYKPNKNDDFYNYYLNFCDIIKKYKSNHIALEDAVNILNDKSKKPISNLNMKLRLLCVNIKINNNIKGIINMFKSNRLDKYTDENYNFILLCLEDLYSYIEYSKEYNINNYETLLNNIKNYYRDEDFYKTKKQSNCEKCFYYNGYCCENPNISSSFKLYCEYYESR